MIVLSYWLFVICKMLINLFISNHYNCILVVIWQETGFDLITWKSFLVIYLRPTLSQNNVDPFDSDCVEVA